MSINGVRWRGVKHNKEGDFTTLAKVMGSGFITVGQSAILYALVSYLQAESTIRINFDMCLFD